MDTIVWSCDIAKYILNNPNDVYLRFIMVTIVSASQTPLYSICQAIAVILCVIFIIWNIKMAFEHID